MPSQKKKPKQESKPPAAVAATAAAPVQIKAEPLDIKPLSAFVDDRVELIRQAFMSLKPKEIKCLAPDFMDGKSIEHIQEQCLDEVLGISTKRLLSIINSTKCPTDTESSSDDDEQKIMEHISLDEISSDSEVEVKPVIKSSKPRDKKLTKKAAKTGGEQPKRSNQPEVAANKNGDKKSEKEMTVLELLELQARARAIRSQLALEPVTKIELDSDQEAEPATDEQPAKKPQATTSSAASSKSPPPEEQQTKRVRLKRNFRIRQVGEEDVPDEASQDSEIQKPKEPTPPIRKSRSRSKELDAKEAKADEPVEKKSESVEKDASRDSSPEVIPLIPSPETLCISSDSEDEKECKRKASIFVENIEELDRKAREQTKATEAVKPVENDEPEEGEVSEEEKSPQRKVEESVDGTLKTDHKEPETSLEHDEELDYEVKEISDSEPDTSAQENNDTSKTDAENQPTKNDEDRPSTVNENSDDSDESEAESVDSDSEVEEQSQQKQQSSDDDPDIVEIHDSSDETLLDQKLAEEEPEKSWNSRWLESNRVAKVMAASRLGNKVRDKLKKKKKKQQQEEQEAAKQPLPEEAPKPAEEEPPAAVSSAEVGSVEHYRELIAKSTEAAKDKEATEENA